MNKVKGIKKENKKQEELYKIEQLLNMQDHAKELLFNSTNKIQEENARSFLDIINQELKMLYIPSAIENV